MQTQTCQNAYAMRIQVNGTVHGTVVVPVGSSIEEVQAAAVEVAAIRVAIGDRKIVRVVFVPGRIFNMIVK